MFDKFRRALLTKPMSIADLAQYEQLVPLAFQRAEQEMFRARPNGHIRRVVYGGERNAKWPLYGGMSRLIRGGAWPWVY